MRNRLSPRSLAPKFVVCGFEHREGGRKWRRQQELFHHWTSHLGPNICTNNFLPRFAAHLTECKCRCQCCLHCRTQIRHSPHAAAKRKSGVKNLHPAELIPWNVIRRPVYAGVSPAQPARPQEATSKPAPASA